LETNAEIIGWEAEDFADGGGDTIRVGVDVVDGLELGGDFVGEALREGMWDLGEYVVGCCER